MKKQILLTIMGVSILSAFATCVQAASGLDTSFCDRYVMNNTPTYTTMCEDANSYDSHMAEFKVRGLRAVMRYVWKTAKRNNRKARFASTYTEQYADVFAQYNKDDNSGRSDRAKKSAKDAKEVATTFFKDASYRVRANRRKFALKLKVKF